MWVSVCTKYGGIMECNESCAVTKSGKSALRGGTGVWLGRDVCTWCAETVVETGPFFEGFQTRTLTNNNKYTNRTAFE